MSSAQRYRVFGFLERPVQDQPAEAEGDLDLDYETVGTEWVELSPLSGRERWIADQSRPGLTHRIRMRWREDVVEGWRFTRSDDGRSVYVVARLGEEETGELELLCSEARR